MIKHTPVGVQKIHVYQAHHWAGLLSGQPVQMICSEILNFMTNGLDNEIIFDEDEIYEEIIDVNNNTNIMVNGLEIVKPVFYKI